MPEDSHFRNEALEKVYSGRLFCYMLRPAVYLYYHPASHCFHMFIYNFVAVIAGAVSRKTK